MAHVVLEARLVGAGLDDRVHVRSAGTGGWHVGRADGPARRRDPRPRPATTRAATAGQQFAASWYDEVDLVLAMDTSNLEDLERPAAARVRRHSEGRLRRFRDLDPRVADGDDDRDVPDPYYGADDGFDERPGDGGADQRGAHRAPGPDPRRTRA